MKPSIGRIVIFNEDKMGVKYFCNKHPDHPAVITKVWSDDCVNVKVLFDCGPTEDRTSCMFSLGHVSWPERV